MCKTSINKLFLLLFYWILLFICILKKPKDNIKIIITSKFWEKIQKYFFEEKHKILINKFPFNKEEKVFMINSKYNKVELSNGYILKKNTGEECIKVYTKKNKLIYCFNIYNSPEINLIKNMTIKMETNTVKLLNLDIKNYPKINLTYKSNHPNIINIDNNGKMTSIRPGNAMITVSTFDKKIAEIKVISINNKGFINKLLLEKYKACQYNKLMIVAHPDDEILWGGENLIKDNYFVICLTNGYNFERANDFLKILKFTNNSGLILDYPDIEDNIIDDWLEVKTGILKDISTIINYKDWLKIVTYGPEGTTGHIHHKKISKYVTDITKKYNKFNNLYYFGRFYKKNEIPKNLLRMNNNSFELKKKEVEIYKSVKNIIYRLWYHMLPYENWVKASTIGKSQ